MRPLTAVLLAALAATLACNKMPRSMEPTVPAPGPDVVSQLWVDPGDVTTRDLFLGAGGAEWKPADGATFDFVRKDTSGYSWGFDLRDEKGVAWSAKYGPEARTEVTVSRLLWAMGYHQLPTYHVERWQMRGSADVPQASRFRPLPPGYTKVGEFELHRNPFVGTLPYNGLLAFMRIVNNWDLLDRNTAVYDRSGGAPTRIYLIQDLGASLGRTEVFPHSGTRNDVEDFENQGFIKGVEKGFVKFDDLGRSHRGLFEAIRPEELAWICERLDRLTDQQWNDAFRAGGYTPEPAARFIRKIRANVAAGKALAAAR